MSDPFADDGWDELTRELGVEKAPPAAEAAEEDPAHGLDSEFEPQGEGDEFDSGLEPEGDAPDGVDSPSDDQPGTGKKRRRRRRRRKKGPGEGDAADVAAPADEPAAPAAADEEPEYAENEYQDGPDSDSDQDELVPVGVGAEEDTAGEALRDLIANWNVPSWDSIITGLHRPER